MIFEAKLAAGGFLAGAAGILATGNTTPIELGWLRPLVELGSFGIIAFAAVYVLVRVAPEFIRQLDRGREAFLIELREERHIRQKNFDVLTQNLHDIDRSIQSLERSVNQQKP